MNYSSSNYKFSYGHIQIFDILYYSILVCTLYLYANKMHIHLRINDTTQMLPRIKIIYIYYIYIMPSDVRRFKML